jgi:hypothetical protein
MAALPRHAIAMACSRALGAAREDVLPVRLEPGEEARIAEQAELSRASA